MPYGPKPQPVEVRFWKHVIPGSPGECWEWQGHREVAGYGTILVTHKPKVLIRKAHRLSYEIHHGPIPDGLFVLHRCDNRPCVNPAHLYAGTKADNARDRSSRKRGRENRPENRGEANKNAKLTEAQVRAIIVELQKLPRRSQASIAADFGIKQPQVSRIMLRQTWAHLWQE